MTAGDGDDRGGTAVTAGPRTASPGTGAGSSGAGPRGDRRVTPPRVDLVLAPTPLHLAPRLSRELGVPGAVQTRRPGRRRPGRQQAARAGVPHRRRARAGLRQPGDRGRAPVELDDAGRPGLPAVRDRAARRVLRQPPRHEAGRAEGNMRLHRWLGVDVRFTGAAERSSVDAGIAAVTAELRAAGRRPYPVPRGGATPLGALGYVRASVELAAQLAGLDEPPAGLWLATGSCGTQAGLVAGAALTAAPLPGRGGDGEPPGRGVPRPGPGAGRRGGRAGRDRRRAARAGRAGRLDRAGVRRSRPRPGRPRRGWSRRPRACSWTRCSGPRRWPP